MLSTVILNIPSNSSESAISYSAPQACCGLTMLCFLLLHTFYIFLWKVSIMYWVKGTEIKKKLYEIMCIWLGDYVVFTICWSCNYQRQTFFLLPFSFVVVVVLLFFVLLIYCLFHLGFPEAFFIKKGDMQLTPFLLLFVSRCPPAASRCHGWWAFPEGVESRVCDWGLWLTLLLLCCLLPWTIAPFRLPTCLGASPLGTETLQIVN